MKATGVYMKWSVYGALLSQEPLSLGDMAYAVRNYPNTRTTMPDGSTHIRCECEAYGAIIIEIRRQRGA